MQKENCLINWRTGSHQGSPMDKAWNAVQLSESPWQSQKRQTMSPGPRSRITGFLTDLSDILCIQSLRTLLALAEIYANFRTVLRLAPSQLRIQTRALTSFLCYSFQK